MLLRIETAGYGIGQSLDQSASLVTDCYAFLFDRLAIDCRPSQS